MIDATGHVELFDAGVLVHSTRPDSFLRRSCPVCGERLGVRGAVVLFGDFHAHRGCAKGQRPLRRIAGGASGSSHEGLDLTIRVLTQQVWYMRLFTSQGVNQIPSADSALTGSAVAPYTSGSDPVIECIGSAYSAAEIDPAAWDATILSEGTTARRLVGPDKTFPPSTDDWGIINGFFLATSAKSTGQNTSTALFYANFYDAQPVIMNGPGFTLQLTPYIQLDVGTA